VSFIFTPSSLEIAKTDFPLCFSWEQIGEWNQAQVLYESAQITARTGVLPFTESELALWEDHWIVSAQKLQQVSLHFTTRFRFLKEDTDVSLLSCSVGCSFRVCYSAIFPFTLFTSLTPTRFSLSTVWRRTRTTKSYSSSALGGSQTGIPNDR
jgi:hypothetical protein